MAMPVRMTEPRIRAGLADGSLTGAWRLDPARSSVRLRSRSMWGLASVKGVFGEVTGDGLVAESGEVTGRITVASASVDTGNSTRDAHLRSADLLHSDEHPEIVFTAERITPAGDQVTVTGSLRVRGRTGPLTFPATITASGDDEVRIDAEVPVDRSDFGLDWNRIGMASMKNTLTVAAVFLRH